MSTRAHKLYIDGAEIYEETSQPQYVFSKFLGWDIYCCIDFKHINSITFNDAKLCISFTPTSPLHKAFNSTLSLFGEYLSEIEVDADGILFCAKGGSLASDAILKGCATIPN
jgi:hypothetical protein